MINRKKNIDVVEQIKKSIKVTPRNAEHYDKYKSVYPEKVDLTPNTPIHDAILKELIGLANKSKIKMSSFHNQWKLVEDKMKPYVDPEVAKQVKEATGSVPIYIPLSYATLQTWLTFMVNSFLVQSPIFRYTSLTGQIEDEIGSILMENMIHYQVTSNRLITSLHTAFRDAGIYGIGIVAPSWEMRSIESNYSGQRPYGYGQLAGGRMITYEGNKLINIHPKNFFPDPNVPITRVNYGNFVGWTELTSLNNLKTIESSNFSDPNQGIFNVDYIEEHCSAGYNTLFTHINKVAEEVSSFGVNKGIGKYRMIDDVPILSMYVNLVPEKWGLGDSDKPEMWLFMIAGEKVIINAKKVSLFYDGFPIVVCAPETDGYNVVSPSKLSMMDGMQSMINWLFHSHMTNVRKAINDTIIYNPFLINEEDIRSGKPGKLVRITQVGWGMPDVMNQAIKQLEVQDVTRGHMEDISALMNLREQVTGVSNSVMGIMATTGERRTRFEAESAFNSASNRIETDAFIMQAQAIVPLGKMMALHTAQFMSQDTILRLSKEAMYKLSYEYGMPMISENLALKVTREDLNVNFDIVVNDNFMNRTLDLAAWSQFLQVVMANPMVAPNIDFNRLILHLLRESGAPNAYDFFNLQPTVMPDEEIEEQERQGNLQPFEEEMMYE